jgi:hypothetical protein
MTDYKPLIYSLAIIFIIGITINLTLDLVDLDLESETEDTYITPFVSTTGIIIDAVALPITFIGDLFTTISNVFTGDDWRDTNYMEVVGTGNHEGFTLDGKYIWSWIGTLKSETEGKNIIQFYRDENDNIINATIRSSEFTFWWFTYKTIYVVEDINALPTMVFNLVATEYDFNSVSTVTVFYDEELFDEPPFNVKVKEFFDEVKDYSQNQVRTFGLIPSFIGLPLILLILVSLFYGIYKIIRP